MANGVADLKSITLRDRVMADWRDRIRKLPPADRDTFLEKPEAIAALGAKRCREIQKAIREDRGRAESILCSAAWIDAAYYRGEVAPVGLPADGRRHDVRLQLSRSGTRYGEGPPRRRWTPPQCVEVEDLIDCQSPLRAAMYPHPDSPSAIAITRICEMKAKPIGGNW